jgi:hypothetical protein
MGGIVCSKTIDHSSQVIRGKVTKDCYEENRDFSWLRKECFGTTICVNKKFGVVGNGPHGGRCKKWAMRTLSKKHIVEVEGMDVLVMNELHFLQECLEDTTKESNFLLKVR